MAKMLPKQAFLDNITYGPGRDIIEVAGKVMRTKIIYDRNERGYEKAEINGTPDSYEFDPTSNRRGSHKPYQQEILTSRGTSVNNIPFDSYTSEPANKRKARTEDKDYVTIIDIDYGFKAELQDNESRRYSSIKLPFVPDRLQYDPNSDFVGISSFGRNNPYYHYTGSEDTLVFNIDWFSTVNSRRDVIFHCRWMEALTKGNGYNDIPHRVILAWGNDNLLFSNSVWIVESAKYELSQFINAYRDNGAIKKVGLLPQQAMQKVVLKRITNHNRDTSEIVGNIYPTSNENG